MKSTYKINLLNTLILLSLTLFSCNEEEAKKENSPLTEEVKNQDEIKEENEEKEKEKEDINKEDKNEEDQDETCLDGGCDGNDIPYDDSGDEGNAQELDESGQDGGNGGDEDNEDCLDGGCDENGNPYTDLGNSDEVEDDENNLECLDGGCDENGIPYTDLGDNEYEEEKENEDGGNTGESSLEDLMEKTCALEEKCGEKTNLACQQDLQYFVEIGCGNQLGDFIECGLNTNFADTCDRTSVENLCQNEISLLQDCYELQLFEDIEDEYLFEEDFEECCSPSNDCDYANDGDCDCPGESWDSLDCQGWEDNYDTAYIQCESVCSDLQSCNSFYDEDCFDNCLFDFYVIKDLPQCKNILSEAVNCAEPLTCSYDSDLELLLDDCFEEFYESGCYFDE